MNIKLVIKDAIKNHKNKKNRPSETELFNKVMDSLTQRANIRADICLRLIRQKQYSIMEGNK